MSGRGERDVVRDLARRVAEIAASERNAAIIRRWQDTNALRRPDRPPVWCRPVGAWSELLPDEALCCSAPRLRAMETAFRQVLIKHDIGDDSPVGPHIEVPVALAWDPPSLWGLEVRRHRPGARGGAWAYDPPLRSPDDFDKLRLPSLRVNDRETREQLEFASDLVGDIMPVRLACRPALSCNLGTTAADLRGLTQMMLDMADAPELVHRLMGHLRDGVLGALGQLEATGLLTPDSCEPMTCSDPVGPPPADGRFGLRNFWAMCNSQEFDQVSPAMWEEFCLAYQKPILARFGLVAYGCCEDLTHKIAGVLSIPNLRIFVCSAWTDLGRVLEQVGEHYVIMWRQKASDVVFARDEDVLRRNLNEGLDRLRDRRIQIVLRELQTLDGRLDRLHVWTRLAIEAAERFAG